MNIFLLKTEKFINNEHLHPIGDRDGLIQDIH